MTIKANGRWVSIIAAGIWICISGPLLAAPGGESASAQAARAEATAAGGKPVALRKYAKHSGRHWKRHASARKHRKTAGYSRHKEIASVDMATAGEWAAAPALPENIANANAELLSANTPPDAADARLVSADQLNDVDRTLSENTASTPTETSKPAPLLTMATANAPVATSTPTTASAAVSSEDTAWSKSSIIGKIFIAFGGLLTLASAARMFMA
jgi:hypothetical protein